jgi:hypothetical protein
VHARPHRNPHPERDIRGNCKCLTNQTSTISTVAKFFSSSDLHGKTPQYTIGKTDKVELKGKDGTSKKRYLIYFDGVEKPLVLNKTNATRLAAAFGKNRSGWVGKTVELYSEPTNLGEGVRIRPLKPTAASDDSINL